MASDLYVAASLGGGIEPNARRHLCMPPTMPPTPTKHGSNTPLPMIVTVYFDAPFSRTWPMSKDETVHAPAPIAEKLAAEFCCDRALRYSHGFGTPAPPIVVAYGTTTVGGSPTGLASAGDLDSTGFSLNTEGHGNVGGSNKSRSFESHVKRVPDIDQARL